MRKSALIAILAFWAFVLLPAQVVADCMVDIENYINQMKDIGSPEDGQTYKLDYSVKTNYSPKAGVPNQTVRFVAYITNRIMVAESDVVSIYADTLDSFMALHKDKIIHQSKGEKNQLAENDALKMAQQQLLIIKSCTPVKCEKQTIEGVLYHSSRFLLSKEMSDELHIKSIDVLYNIDQQRIYHVIINYNPGQPVITQQITYNLIDYNNTETLKKSARSYIFSGSRLNSKYRDYTLINNK